MCETLYSNFQRAALQHPDRIALMSKTKGRYTGIAYRELLFAVDTVAANLQHVGLRKGDAVGILSANRPEWAIADLAAMKLGCVVVPIYPTSSLSHVRYVALDAGIKLMFVENDKLLGTIQNLPDCLDVFPTIVLLDDAAVPTASHILKFSYLRTAWPNGSPIRNGVKDDDAATIVYTSGTTGEPKGVVLTHRNIVSNALAVKERFGVGLNDVMLSYLPLSHMFERTCGYYSILFAGGTIAYAESAVTVAEDVQLVRPTIFLAVPSVLEKAYRRVVGKVRTGSSLRRSIISLAIKALNEHTNRTYRNQPTPWWLKAASLLSNRYVAFRFRQLAGGRLRVVASGGAPLDRKIAKLYHVLGFTIAEGYGLTETSPIVACHTLGKRTLGTVGPPLTGVEVRLGDQDEILVRGPNVMRGYFNRPEETAHAIDPEGWFHTGDQGRFDEDHNLIITGRLKEIIVLSNGKKVSGAAIESRLVRSEYIAQAVLFGDRRNFVVALLVPDRESVMSYAQRTNLPAASYEALLQSPDIRDLLRHQIDLAMAEIQPHERVRAFALLADPFTVENGFLTLTLKLRRQQIEKQHRELLDRLYEPVRSASHSPSSELNHAA